MWPKKKGLCGQALTRILVMVVPNMICWALKERAAKRKKGSLKSRLMFLEMRVGSGSWAPAT